MDTFKVRADEIDPNEHALVLANTPYMLAGNAYAESNMLIINFFLGGIHRGLLGKIIVTKDFILEVDSKEKHNFKAEFPQK